MAGKNSDCIEKACAWWVNRDYGDTGHCGVIVKQPERLFDGQNGHDLRLAIRDAMMGHAAEMAAKLKQIKQAELEKKWKP